MKYYKEWSSKVNSRKGNMVTIETLGNLQKTLRDTGFMGVYAFGEEDALAIIQTGQSRGLGQYAVGSDVIIIDLDDGEPQLIRAEAKLRELGLAYEVYLSGGKGYHLYIPQTKWIYDKRLPYSQRQFAVSLDIGADESLYQHGRLVSMVGRVHHKTKKKKELIKTIAGDKVDLQLINEPVNMFNFDNASAPDSLGYAIASLKKLIDFEPVPGNRHTAICGVSADLTRSGLSPNLIEEILQAVNGEWKNQKTEEEITAAVVGGIKMTMKRTEGVG